MKQNILRALKTVSLLLAIVFALVFIQDYVFLTSDTGTKVRVRGFYMEEENSIDVGVIGASEIFAGYSAGQAYRDYGFTSYPLCVQGDPVDLWISQLKEYESTQNPKIYIMEINGVTYDEEIPINVQGNARRYIDNMKPSKNRFDTVMDHCATADEMETLGYLFPLVKYHSQWDEPEALAKNVIDTYDMDNRGYTLLKGMRTCTFARSNQKHVVDVYHDTSTSPLAKNHEETLRKTLDYIKDNKLNVVFTRFPHIIVEGDSYIKYQRENMAEEIIKSYGFDVINFDTYGYDYGIDYKKDFYNREHLNIRGQQKITDALGKIFTEKYGITPSKLSAENEKRWKEAVEYTNLYFDYCEASTKKNKKEWLFEDADTLKLLDNYKKNKKSK